MLENLMSERVKSLPPSVIRRFYDQLPGSDNLISLGIGEPGFPTPPRIREAAIREIEKGYVKYTRSLGMPELRQELSQYLKKRYGLEYDPDSELVITGGVGQGLDLLFRAIINPGDEVILPEPHYASYPPRITLSGGVAVTVSTTEENNFEITATDIEARVTSKTKAILLNYPTNPTGAVMPRDKLLQIAEVAKRHNLPIISDEIYSKLVYGVEHTCIATLPSMKEQTILLDGFSKAYAMAGWRVGYIAAIKEIISSVLSTLQYTMLCISTVCQAAALEALRTGDEDAEEMVKEYNKRRLLIIKGLNDIGLSCYESRGAFYAFPSIKSTGMSSLEFAEKLLKEELVVVIPGTAYGKAGEGYIRCTYTPPLPDIEEALVRMERFVKRYT